MTKAPTPTEMSKGQVTTQTTPQKSSIKQRLRTDLGTIIRNSFIHEHGNRRYKYLVLCREGPYFVKEHSD